eukprot:CAMPEP_0174368340 /NCGR_PEP_ID=MMETSP0811_2-20130205/88690_1 /TAXON_ID=73025 ORGANISM="Eutreptiella gymnastica-like, Strain CCMP1594" /NCGR_SAMPLE_ID=MMETSP0811_2 /ASSEMBLY_ACC=CAM_ASM_000667 /LENGTH=78 /DNA_ID=CAMNT_0015511761 /DNA_START=11 /DNA_END=243 /DNA_ORIENTATION=-
MAGVQTHCDGLVAAIQKLWEESQCAAAVEHVLESAGGTAATKESVHMACRAAVEITMTKIESLALESKRAAIANADQA